ncbi:hypothetical protein RND71_031707 [Anisodus tanguticus]|uniref:3-beta hydroxysteroid dehydrogenase/isomerase domain-containing protein n=1 Tax=Anisodus tanguticus TaxID=243964 RepID=A0AAE1UZ51_9SOLA|nr:hypothetical protein RND71_031707 [Anisodus tanguticus]
MHLSEKEGIEKNSFVVTGGVGFVGSALCIELVRRGARIVKSFDVRTHSPFSPQLLQNGVHLIQEMLQYSRVDEVNINGTCHVIDACLDHQIKRLVYVSTPNVVYGGKEIVNGNENLPYVPIDDHVDPYGRSKSIADQLVLKSNGRPFNCFLSLACMYNSREEEWQMPLHCAIRPVCYIWAGEERHLPRIVNLAKLGLLPFKIGSPNVKSDWVYVDNLVLALLLASMGLLDDIPGERRASNCRRWLPQPLILPAEVYKVGVTHYFSFLKAKEELGYVPMVSYKEGMTATISYWQERKRRNLDGPTIWAWLFSAAAHLGEGIYAWNLAKRIDPANARGWFWQTFALGFFSLRLLLKRAKK